MATLTSCCPALLISKTGEAATHPYEETMDNLVRLYSATLYRVAYSALRNSADAEDVVQESFLRVVRNFHKFSQIENPRVWLIRIAWNLALDHRRKKKTHPQGEGIEEFARILPSAGLSAEERIAAAEHHASIMACVDQLPAKERQVLILFAIEELGSVEIAKVLHVSESSVRSRLYRARNLMGAMLGHQRERIVSYSRH